MPRGGRSPKRKGYYYEKRMEAALARFGFKRMVMSGALGGDHAGDLRRSLVNGEGLAVPGKALHVVEVKRRAGGQKTLRRWLMQGDADCLLLPGDRGQEALAVLGLAELCQLLEEAGYVPRE